MEHEGRTTVEIAGTYFFDKLKTGYDDPDKYTSKKSFCWWRQQGHAMVTGIQEQIGLLINIDQNHWVAVVLDFPTFTCWYGDSLGGKRDAHVCKVLDWWTHLHTGRQFRWKALPITLQTDGYSCGLLVWNALSAFFLEEKYDLLDPNKVADGRLEILLRIIERHNLCDTTIPIVSKNLSLL
jgi:Ulp1 family protease